MLLIYMSLSLVLPGSDKRSCKFQTNVRATRKTTSGTATAFGVVCMLMFLGAVAEAGTWTALTHAPPAGLNNALLLGDGTVMCGDGGKNWYRLTPDIHGSYISGTWTTMASMRDTRLFYASQVLTNGNVFVCGGEYGTGRGRAEVYNPLANSWTSTPLPGIGYSDAESKMLPNGNVVLEHSVYSVASNSWISVNALRGQGEACWVKLPDDSILTVDGGANTASRFIPAQNKWISDTTCPVALYGYGFEEGATHLLPNGKVFFIGGTVNTAIYTPSGSTAAGTWAAGPTMMFGTNALGAVDAPSALMVNGRVLCALGPTNGFNSPTYFYEYDYTTNGFTQVDGPTGPTYNNAPFASAMLDLPDGNVLFIGGQGSTKVYVYAPDGTPLTNGLPVISNITENVDGSYHLTGTGLNGITGGASYGDDWQMDSNYPVVRMTNSVTGNVYYARTYGWNSTGVATGNRVVTTEFTLPANLTSGTYSLVVTANGNSSAPTNFTYAPLSAPTGLVVTNGLNAQVGLSWNAVSGATSYNLKRYTTSGGPYYSLAVNLTGTNYQDAGLVNGTGYFYVVSAVGSGGPSANSPQVIGTPVGPPPIPAGFNAMPGNGQLTLTWTASFGATSYNLQRSTTSGGPYTTVANPTGTTYINAGLVNGTTYYYVLSAVNSHGPSANSGQVSAAPSTVANGLIGYWKFDEGSGISAADSSGNNNVGTLANSPSWVAPGKVGPAALQLNAANLQMVSVSDATSLDPTSGLTITAWVNAANWSGNRRVLQKGDGDNQYRLLAEGGVFKFDLSGVGTLTTTLPAVSTWVHVAGTWNGTTMVIYYNGVSKASLAASGTNGITTDALAIGAKNGSSATGDYFLGTLDDVRVYNRGLSASEIAVVMAPPLGVPTGLTTTPGNAQVSLAWAVGAGATSYHVKRSTTSGGPYTIVASPTATSYLDTGLANATIYYYVVSAVNASGEGANSVEASATPFGPPIVLTASPTVNGQFSLQFAGTDGQNYVVETSSNLVNWTAVYTNMQSGGSFLFTDANATNFTSFYRVRQ
ncbi:LamG-like jellyroll fold domain-containing protein [Pedosphaera parvula]|uniref:Fibronectin type III domain protein n=1 Tax=Pedosphaera parvula (strain Ellin514) TaxID=320771 RepID=B9XHK0_PEDPL|nr:LamG-like jellyroll fold domain-containing protein [Pedosphaera parvula]EEF60578.1 Fibronectin type III domain protein [Pedosphaera parvula Ellin514]